MKNIYLHIGAHKTGTSAIQEALGTLQKSGNLEQHDFAFALLGDDVHTLCNTKTKKEHFCNLFQEKLENFIASTPVSNFIFSFEGLSSSQILENTHILDTLSNVFSSYQTHIIYYLRRQDTAYESLWAQRHKHFLSPIELNPPQSIFKNVLDLYAKYFGKENIIVRIYDKKNLYRNNSIYDFLQCLNLADLIDVYENISSQTNTSENQFIRNSIAENSSMSPSNLRINLSYMRQNRLNPEEIPTKKKQLEENILHKKQSPSSLSPSDLCHLHADFLLIEQGINANIAFAETLQKLYALGNTNESNSHAYMPAEMRQKFLDECKEENAYIAREYLHKDSENLFDMQMPKECISIESPSTDDLVQSFLPMFVHLKQGIDTLKEENKKNAEELQHLHEENKKILDLLTNVVNNNTQEKNKQPHSKNAEKSTKDKQEVIHLTNLKKGHIKRP